MKTLVLFGVLAISIFPTFSARIYINVNAVGNNDGTSWTDAYTELQSGLDNSLAGDTLWVAEGIYYPTEITDGNVETADKFKSFHIANKDIKLFGGFTGNETSLTQRNWSVNTTILSGDFNDDDAINGLANTLIISGNSENAYNVVTTVGLTNAFELDGFTITGGNASSSLFFNYETLQVTCNRGAGMTNLNSSPSISNCTYIGNMSLDGGAMLNYISSPIIYNSRFITNRTNGYAGAIFNQYSEVHFEKVWFYGNRASTIGGGMYNHMSTPTILNTVMKQNFSGTYGGGMINDYSSTEMINVTFEGNNSGQGGAIYNFISSSDTVTVTNCLFFGNTSDLDNTNMLGTLNVTYSLTQVAPTAASGTLNESNNLTPGTDPLFLNAGDFDGADNILMSGDDGLALQGSSPCVAMGTSNASTSYDITGQTRPTPPSIGAYEISCTTTSGTDIQSACNSFVWMDGNTYTSDNNTATYVLTNANGCDSIVTLDLTINSIDATVNVVDFTLSANLSGIDYQWIDCDNGNQAISGETNQSFTATANGNYAVIVDNGTCSDTSVCQTISSIGLTENDLGAFVTLYPVPASTSLVIQNSSENIILGYQIIDLSGKVLIEKSDHFNQDVIVVDLQSITAGTYLIRLDLVGQSIAKRLVIVR